METIKTNNEFETSERILYTCSPFITQNMLYPQELGVLKSKKIHPSSHDMLQSALLFMVEKGSGELHYGDKIYSLTAGDFIFIYCTEKYLQLSSDDLWTLRWFHFNCHNMKTIYDKYLLEGGNIVFRPSILEKYKSIYKKLTADDSDIGFSSEITKSSLIAQLLENIFTDSLLYGQGSSYRRRHDMYNVAEYISTHFAEKLSLDMLAEKFYINSAYLGQLFYFVD